MADDKSAVVDWMEEELSAEGEDGERRHDRITRMVLRQLQANTTGLMTHVKSCDRKNFYQVMILVFIAGFIVATHPKTAELVAKILAAL